MQLDVCHHREACALANKVTALTQQHGQVPSFGHTTVVVSAIYCSPRLATVVFSSDRATSDATNTFLPLLNVQNL